MNWQNHIHVDPDVLAGKPIVKGTRLSVHFLLSLMAEGWTETQLLENYPQLSHKTMQAVFAFCADTIRDAVIYPINTGTARCDCC